jgi:CubicO group peptidase (beta-lactamase class C family)
MLIPANLSAQDFFENNTKNPSVLLDTLKRIMNREHIPGMFLVLVKGDSVLFSGGIGYADVENKLTVTDSTLFRMGSVTKSFVSLGLLKLEEAGAFSLDNKIRDIAPEIPIQNKWEDQHPVLAGQLLEHTAGFDDMHFREIYDKTGTGPLPLLEVLKRFPAPLETRWTPGTRHSYANPGYTASGYLIEKFTGDDYENYLESSILNPVGMNHSHFSRTARNEDLIAKGYNFNKDSFQTIPFYPIYHRPAGALLSCAKDMGAFLRIFLNDGNLDSVQVFSPELLRKMEKPYYSLAAQKGLNEGYGLGNYKRESPKGFSFHGHDGGIDGFSSAYGYSRELGVGYAFSKNALGGERRIRNAIMDFLTPVGEAARQPAQSLNKSAIIPFEGYYRYCSPRNEVLAFLERLSNPVYLYVQNDTLRMRSGLNLGKTNFIPVGDLKFRKTDQFQGDALLTLDESGKAVFIQARSASYYEKTPLWKLLSEEILFFGSLFLGVLAVLIFLFSIVLRFTGRVTGPDLRARILPVLAILSLGGFVAIFILGFQNFMEVGEPNPYTIGIFVLTLLFSLFSFFSLLMAVLRFRIHTNRFTAIFYLLTGLGLTALSVYLFLHHIIGLRLWAW